MSIVCKQLTCYLNRFLICHRPTMVMSPFKTGSHRLQQRSSSDSPSVIQEVEGDLFSAKRSTSLAHCVSSDMKMGAGIAVYFRLKFGRVDELLKQKKTVGQVAFLKDSQRFIFYLVTKNRYYDKPTEQTLHCSLLDMREKCMKLGVTKLAMPRIGCGLDGLKWPLVSHLVHEVFQNCGMEITIYSIPDRRPKPMTMTPNMNRTREQFRNFFEPKRPVSLPAAVMKSKRKFHTDSSEEDYDTPKRRKLLKSGSLDDDNDSDSWPRFKERSSNEKRLSSNHRKADLEYDSQESDSLAHALSTFSGECPFSSRSKERNEGRKIYFSSSDEDRTFSEEKLRQSPDLIRKTREDTPSPASSIQEKRRSSNKVLSEEKHKKEKRRSSSQNRSEERIEKEKRNFASNDCSEEKEKRRSSSKSRSEEKLKKEKRRSSSKSRSEEKLKKEKRRSSSKNRSEEKIKKEKRRSSSKNRSEEKPKKAKRRSLSLSSSEEKPKKEKRRSSSKNRSEEKSKKGKRRSLSLSSSDEKPKKEKRRSSSKSRSEEKPKKEKRKSSDSLLGWTVESFDSSPSKSCQTNLVSQRFPSVNKETPPADLSSVSNESIEIKPKCLNELYDAEDGSLSGDESIMSSEPTTKEDASLQETEIIQSYARSPVEVLSDARPRFSTGSKCLSDQLKERLGGFVKTPRKEEDDGDNNSVSQKVKKTPEQSRSSPKPSRKSLKSPIGKMYSDQETAKVSVKARLSLNHKL